MGGADLALARPAPVTFELLVAARLEPAPTAATEALRKLGPLDKPYWHLERARLGPSRTVAVELLVNGQPVESRVVAADGAERLVRFEHMPRASCWVAVRIAHGAHSNPIWVTIADKPVRVALQHGLVPRRGRPMLEPEETAHPGGRARRRGGALRRGPRRL